MLKKVVYKTMDKGWFFRIFVVAGLSIMLALGAVGCSKANPPSETEVDLSQGTGDVTQDTRASAAQTFGGQVLVDMQAQSQQAEPEEVLALTPGDSITSLSQFMDVFSHTLSPEAKPYARLWHGSPVLGSGWSERFALYDNGSFIWGANQMDGATRLRYFAGTWDVSQGNLVLTSKLAIAWEGGDIVENPGGSYGSEEVIMNPQIVLSRTEDILTLPLGRIEHDSDRNLDTAIFNKLQCWDYSTQKDNAMQDFWQILTNL